MSSPSNRPTQAPHIVVVGAGITGLAAAHSIAQQAPGAQLTVLEARDRLGGNIITERRDGFLLDGGPDSFVRTKPHATRLIEELGLKDQLITTQSRRVYLVHQGKLVEMPAGMALAIPTRLGPMVSTPILSWPGKLRMLADLFLPAGALRESVPEESVHNFIARRFGREVAEQLAGPLLGGIYAGDVTALGIESTFPQLALLEERYGSLILGLYAGQAAAHQAAATGNGSPAKPRKKPGIWDLVGALRWLRREERAAPSPFYSLAGGIGDLIQALADKLPPQSIQLASPLRQLTQSSDSSWVLGLDGGKKLHADAVILATPAHVTAALLPGTKLAKSLQQIPYVSTATVFFALSREEVAHPLDGVGFIAPRGEAEIVAGTWISSKWAGRAPADGALVRAFLGGVRDRRGVDSLSDEDLVELSRRELERLMGPLGKPRFTRVFRYARANPQPIAGHAQRLLELDQLLNEGRQGLYLAGAAYDGVGIPDCVRQGQSAATRALGRLLSNSVHRERQKDEE